MYPIPGVGTVNLNNGNLHIEIPIWTAKGRNGSTETTSITYDNSTYLVGQEPVEGGSPGATKPVWSTVPGYPGWISSLTIAESPAQTQGRVTHDYVNYLCGSSQIAQYTNWQYVDPHGTIHPFPSGLYTERGGGVTGCPDDANAEAVATDGSGYWLEVSDYDGPTVYDMYGNNVTTGEDANGNKPNGTTGDLLGRSWSYLPKGFTVATKTIYIWTALGGAAYELGPTQGTVISSITLPDGRSYSFQYDDAGPPNSAGTFSSSQQGHYGTLTGITLPTGGQISIASIQNSTQYPTPLVVGHITTPDGTWTFNYVAAVLSTLGTVITPGVTTATAPVNPQTGLASQTTVSASGFNQVISTYAGTATGTPLRTITVTNPGRPSSIATTLDNGQSSHVDYTYADTCTPRVSTKKEYDFSGNLARETDVSYYTTASDNSNLCTEFQYPGSFASGGPSWGSPYLQTRRNISAIPSSVKVYGPSGSSGAPIAETAYTYDSTDLSTSSGSAGNSVLGLAVHDDVNFGSGTMLRGNLTAVSQMVSQGTFITTKTNDYNILGEVVKSTDGNGNSTNYDFTDKWNDSSCISAPVFAYPTTITNAKGQVSHTTYNSCDGSIASVQDPNDISTGRSGTVYTYDGRQRVTNISYPDTGNTSTDYGGSVNPEVMTTKVAQTASTNQVSTVTLDGLGRAVTSVGANGAIVNTTYDAWNRVTSISNPHFSTPSPSDGTTYFGYDSLGRKVSQTQQDGSSLTWHYSGNTTDSYDESGVHIQQTFDAFGRLIQVMELGTTASPLGLETDYTYDSLNNLKLVNQHGVSGEAPRIRTFSYDSLSRLVESYNPESGVICYGTTGGAAPSAVNCTSGYDSNGNLHSKTVGRGTTTTPFGVTITYNYDALNRLTGKTYSDATPPVTYNYDENTVAWLPTYPLYNAIGRLSSTSVGGANPYIKYAYTYDAMGRPNGKYYQMPNLLTSAGQPNGGSNGDSYDLAGNVTFTGMGPGIYLYQTRDNAGHVTGVTSDKATTGPLSGVRSQTLFANATYTPFGALSSRKLGNGLTETRTYDKRLRVASITQSMPGSTVGYSVSIEYYPNGNVSVVNDSVNGNWIYQYDSLNRLTGASSSSGLNLSWVYDSFGNRWSQSASGSGSAPQPSFTFTGNNNRTDLSNGLVYDAAGNVQLDNLNQGYTYDAEGRITSASLSTGGTATYQYDSEGNLAYETGGSGSQIFVRNTAGQPVFVYPPDGTTGPYYNFIAYIDGELIGSWENQTFFWAGKDWLGTKRYETTGTGDIGSVAAPIYRNAYTNLPFGDALSSIGFDPQHFTGKERDIESGLDYFGARHYTSSMGRFMNPDPSGLYFANLADPQSLNLYSYVRNNPLTNTDPTGLDCVYLDNTGFGVDTDPDNSGNPNGGNGIDHHSSQGECNGTGGYWAPGYVANANSVTTYSNSDLVGIDSIVNNQTVSSIANCEECSTTNSDGSLMGAMTQTFGNQTLGEQNLLFINSPNNPSPRPMDHVTSWPPPLTRQQIYKLCFIAATLRGGGNVPGNAGTASSSPSLLESPKHLQSVPDEAGRTNLRYIPMNSGAAVVDSPLYFFAIAGSTGSCVDAVTSAN